MTGFTGVEGGYSFTGVQSAYSFNGVEIGWGGLAEYEFIPLLDSDGNPVLDSDGNPIMTKVLL